jgi:hypothetical protein
MREPTREYIFPQSPEGQNSVVMDILELPVYELEDDKMRIHDVVWGDCEIGDRQPYDSLLMELARSPLFRRLQAVEQLTLPPRASRLCRIRRIFPVGSISGAAWHLFAR